MPNYIILSFILASLIPMLFFFLPVPTFDRLHYFSVCFFPSLELSNAHYPFTQSLTHSLVYQLVCNSSVLPFSLSCIAIVRPLIFSLIQSHIQTFIFWFLIDFRSFYFLVFLSVPELVLVMNGLATQSFRHLLF